MMTDRQLGIEAGLRKAIEIVRKAGGDPSSIEVGIRDYWYECQRENEMDERVSNSSIFRGND